MVIKLFPRKAEIILAITAKDILDAIKNKSTLTLLASTLVLVAFFVFMPRLSDDGTPLVFLADAGHSAFTTAIARSNAMQVRLYDTADEMQADFIRQADKQLALVLPANFDQILAEGGVPQIQGYALKNWIHRETTREQKAYLEAQITAIVGAPVQINMTGGTLYMLPESNGGFLEAIGITIIVLMSGTVLVPSLMLEEKRARTLDALLVSPAGSGQIAIAKTLAGVFYVSIFAILVVAVNAYLVLQWGLAVGSMLLGILLSVAIGLLLGILIENRQQLTMATQLLLIPLVGPIILRILGDLLPVWLVKLTEWMPTVAMFDLLRISFSNQAEPGLFLPRLGVLAACSVALLEATAWLIRRTDR